MYRVKVHNETEVIAALKRIDKRKGKLISCNFLVDGDLFRNGAYGVNVFHLRDGGKYSVYPAWEELLGSMCVGYGGTVENLKDSQVTLLARKGDYPEPEKESPVKTVVHTRADGTYCCQNFIYSMSGQHFHITADLLVELKAKNDRDWLDSPTPCTCDLELGKVREYDGQIHGGISV